MKTLLVVAVIFGFYQFDTLKAETMPPLPDYLRSCHWVTDYAMQCDDGFGNIVTCRPVITQYSRRWSCR